MRKRNGVQFVQTGEGFNPAINFDRLKKYLMPITDSVLSQDPQIVGQIRHHLEKAKNVLNRELPHVAESIRTLEGQLDHDCMEDFILPAENPINKHELALLKFTIAQISQYNLVSVREKLEQLKLQYSLMSDMAELAAYMLENRLPVSIKVQRIVQPRERTIWTCNLNGTSRAAMLRRYANRLYLYVQLVPPPFRSKNLNRDFLDDIIDSARRKPETTYFDEVKGEDELSIFLTMPQSPLVGEGILPYNGSTNPDDIKEWIDLATVILAEFDQTEDEDRAATIAILAERFLFKHTYPLLYPRRSNPSLIKRLENFRRRTPSEIGIHEKYVPRGYYNRPAYEMFAMDERGKEPIELLQRAELAVCPAEAGYCVVKAHEALSVLCVRREMDFKGREFDKEEFAERMPGFDDIFELWLAFLASANLGDPKGLVEFVNGYSRLPGFSARVLASIAYLEASLAQLEDEPESGDEGSICQAASKAAGESAAQSSFQSGRPRAASIASAAARAEADKGDGEAELRSLKHGVDAGEESESDSGCQYEDEPKLSSIVGEQPMDDEMF